MNRKIDYKLLLKNVCEMIILLEFDSMRSSSKCKLNAPHLDALYRLKDRYETKISKLNKKEEK